MVTLGKILRAKPPKPEPQFQPYKLIKQCQQVSKCNGRGDSFDETDKKFYSLGRNELEWYGKVTSTKEQYEIGQQKTYYCVRKRYLLSRRPYLDISYLDILEDTKMAIETEFEIKVFEHKE